MPNHERSSADHRRQEGGARQLTPACPIGARRAADILRRRIDYTSNAIEGNTLTARKTAELIEHGITVGGKAFRDHLEALDHYAALLWMREIAATPVPLLRRFDGAHPRID